MKTLLDLYKAHTGKVSDKWTLYLREYDRLFAPYRDQAISMLEIGIQNGGSLEIWSQYFPNAQKFVGCDINPDCAQLRYEDPRITVIVGDATAPETQAKVLDQSASFDLIIEDGSHTSSDIVKAFARYFPALKMGGLFVAEDLHCSYWQEYEGGIFHPYSSITFFKHLADIVNHEHWGVEKKRMDLIAGFKQLLEIDFEEEILSQISSIEFINSICIVRKKETIENFLGSRNVAGFNSDVVPVILSLANTKSEPLSQTENSWSNLAQAPAETHQDLVHQIKQTKEVVAQLRNDARAKQAEVTHLSHLVSSMQASRSWRYTAALRQMGDLAGPAVKLPRRIKSAARQYGGYIALANKALNVIRSEGFAGARRRLNRLKKFSGKSINAASLKSGLDYTDLIQSHSNYLPRISIIVPNYNHEKFLRQRFDSIYGQTYKKIEVIVLDDCSTDNSREVISEYAARYSEVTRVHFNEVNSGGVFRQWAKGISLATGDLIWIAESDDYCDLNFLEELVGFFKNEAVMLSFCRTDFIKGGSNTKVWSSEAFWDGLDFVDPSKPFVKSANYLVNKAWAVKNIVSNASSAIFRHPRNAAILSEDYWLNMRLCGDWIFYLNIIKGGLVAYTPNATNYYRQHESGTSVNTQNSMRYYLEHEKVATEIIESYKVKDEILLDQKDSLYAHWCEKQGDSSQDAFEKNYSLERAKQNAKPRKKNVLMVGFALAAGGGETFPIILANQLKTLGYSIGFLNCHIVETETGVRKMLSEQIPLIELNELDSLGLVCEDMGVEVVHSHHAWVDITVNECLKSNKAVARVISMHGMYELMPESQLKSLLPILRNDINKIVYTANKNLTPFPDELKKSFIRIENALERKKINPVARADLGIGEDDFVLCLVSRAIPEKGWEEAIAAVQMAQKHCSRQIQLILIGEGPEYDRLNKSTKNSFIHFLGFKSNIRDYFSMSDVGFLPSRFKGESFPLVIIDCLFSGKPVIASSIGEISEMLLTERGPAGALFDLNNFTIAVDSLSRLIAKLVNDNDYFDNICANVEIAAKKFDIELMVNKYADVYEQACQSHTGISDA